MGRMGFTTRKTKMKFEKLKTPNANEEVYSLILGEKEINAPH